MELLDGSSAHDALIRTRQFYDANSVEDYVKTFDAMTFVEDLFDETDTVLVSANWNKRFFMMHMIVDSNRSRNEIVDMLTRTSLEDSMYESCGENGWVLFTRGAGGEVYRGRMSEDRTHVVEYGLVDYRSNPIGVVRA